VEPSGYTSTSYNWASGTENYGDRAGIDRHPGVSGRGSHVGLRRRRTIASIRPGPNLRKTISYEGENCGGLHFAKDGTLVYVGYSFKDNLARDIIEEVIEEVGATAFPGVGPSFRTGTMLPRPCCDNVKFFRSE